MTGAAPLPGALPLLKKMLPKTNKSPLKNSSHQINQKKSYNFQKYNGYKRGEVHIHNCSRKYSPAESQQGLGCIIYKPHDRMVGTGSHKRYDNPCHYQPDININCYRYKSYYEISTHCSSPERLVEVSTALINSPLRPPFSKT